MARKNKKYTCCHCAERIRLYDDYSNQPADQPACKHFEKEKI